MIWIDWIVKTVFAGSRWQLLTIGTLGDLRRRIWPHCRQVCSCLQCFVKVVPKLSQSCLQVISDCVVSNHHFDSLSVLPCLPPQYYHYYFFSIAQSPSSEYYHVCFFSIAQFPSSVLSLLLFQHCSVPLFPCQPLAGGETWLQWGGTGSWTRRRRWTRPRCPRGRRMVGGRKRHGDFGQHPHRGKPWGAEICKGGQLNISDFSRVIKVRPSMPTCVST